MTKIAQTETAPVELVEQFKSVFRMHPAGVSLITAAGPDGPVGLTASSVASVSADPAALVFSVTTVTGSAGVILAAPSLVVHLLHSEHVEIAQAFARSGAPRFTPEQGWTTLATGEPVLRSALAMLRCRIIQTVPVGGSTLVVVEVLAIEHGETGTPLVYHDRGFHRIEAAS
ncbi:flavin reductase family protein [Leifsonia sp. YAF41]|uniref:flavin reductase family protein n=1 Tax=Leifsonia sp. YAF41 TaxID=3233086 RepID=UPI003F97EA53